MIDLKTKPTMSYMDDEKAVHLILEFPSEKLKALFLVEFEKQELPKIKERFEESNKQLEANLNNAMPERQRKVIANRQEKVKYD